VMDILKIENGVSAGIYNQPSCLSWLVRFSNFGYRCIYFIHLRAIAVILWFMNASQNRHLLRGIFPYSALSMSHIF
jgi:hypothetical protein